MATKQMASTKVNIESLMGIDPIVNERKFIFPSKVMDTILRDISALPQEKDLYGGIDPGLVARASLYSAMLTQQKQKPFQEPPENTLYPDIRY